jgi:hypothetical protein
MAAIAVTALAACATTQQEAARLRLNSARLRASALPVRVVGENPDVKIEDVANVEGKGESAIVVTMRNLSGRPVSDLPISVGLIAPRGRRVYLNGSAGLSYFDTHVPAIASRSALTWVFAPVRRLRPVARLFANVGHFASVTLPRPLALPRIVIVSVPGSRGPDVGASVRNRSSIPQFQLEVYAIARRRGRYAAAGTATIGQLSPGSSAELRLHLLGTPAGTSVLLEAPPTIFR